MDFSNQTLNQVATFILGGLALTASLGWNEAIKSLVDHYFPIDTNKGGVLIKFIYAFILTIILVILTLILVKIGANSGSQKKCVCAEQEEVRKLAKELNDKIDRTIYAHG